MKKAIERKMALSALAGDDPASGLHALLLNGVHAFRSARTKHADSIRAASRHKGFRDTVRINLPFKGQVWLYVTFLTNDGAPVNAGQPIRLGALKRKSGRLEFYYDPMTLTNALVKVSNRRPAVVVKILLGIERARLRCWSIGEEANRWLDVDSEGETNHE